MVGGGTVHWQGWLPRFTPDDFRLRTVAGDLPGTTLADWPITYDDLEPYYDKVEWAFGVSGQAGANAYEGWRSRGYPCPPMPQSRYAEKFHQGCAKLGWNSFPTPQAALSRPFDGRPATVVSAFAQQHGDPTGTRSSALNVFIPDAVATGRYDLRPDSYVRELVLDARGRIRAAVYEDADGAIVRAGGRRLHPRLRRRRDRPAAAAVDVRPVPRRPGQRQRPRRAQRHLPRVLGLGRHLRRPDLRLGRRRLRQRQQLPVLQPRRRPAASSAAGTSRRPVSASRCRSTGACPVGRPGAQRPSRSTATTSTTAWRSPWCCTTCRSTTTGSISTDTVIDAWGLPVARITLTPHENDLAQGRFLVDRCGEILEAAGARTVDRVYAERVTGNCSHQHGTTRMGDDPETSVLDRNCRAHEVDNLFVVDGSPFPTATGANPTLTIMANAWRVAEHIAGGGRG